MSQKGVAVFPNFCPTVPRRIQLQLFLISTTANYQTRPHDYCHTLNSQDKHRSQVTTAHIDKNVQNNNIQITTPTSADTLVHHGSTQHYFKLHRKHCITTLSNILILAPPSHKSYTNGFFLAYQMNISTASCLEQKTQLARFV